MINLLEEEYDAASGKYILHLTMGTGDTTSDLPSAEKPFNSSNYSCFFDYGEPAEESTAVNEITGKLYTYSDGEWIDPEPTPPTPAETKCVLVKTRPSTDLRVNGEEPTPIAEDATAYIIDIGDVLSSIDIILYIACYDKDGTELLSANTGDTPTITIPENTFIATMSR